MVAYDYLKSERDSYSSKSVNVVDLMKKAKFEKKTTPTGCDYGIGG